MLDQALLVNGDSLIMKIIWGGAGCMVFFPYSVNSSRGPRWGCGKPLSCLCGGNGAEGLGTGAPEMGLGSVLALPHTHWAALAE